jgi:hypothetical protein
VKLLRTIRLDPSDTFVFERTAEPGEWAVSGAFAFWNTDPAKLEGKSRAAFRSGFLGVASFGWSTLVQIVEAKPSDRANVVETLRQLVTHFGALIWSLVVLRRKKSPSRTALRSSGRIR